MQVKINECISSFLFAFQSDDNYSPVQALNVFTTDGKDAKLCSVQLHACPAETNFYYIDLKKLETLFPCHIMLKTPSETDALEANNKQKQLKSCIMFYIYAQHCQLRFPQGRKSQQNHTQVWHYDHLHPQRSSLTINILLL